MIKVLSLILVTLSLVSCQSSDRTVNTFQLSQGPNNSVVNFDATQLIIKRIELVDYLKQSNILFELDNGELIATKYQVWAESINQGISRALVNDINHSQSTVRADSASFSSCKPTKPCYELALLVEKFYPSANSIVSFSGKYKLYLGNTLIEQRDFNLSKDLTLDGYPHAVASLKELVGELGDLIIERVSPKM